MPFLRHGRRGVPWTEAVDYLERIRPEPTVYPSALRAATKILEAWEYDWFEERFWALVVPFLARMLTDPVERWNFTETLERAYGPFETIRKDPRPIWGSLSVPLTILDRGLAEHTFLIADPPTAFDFAMYGDFQAAACAGVPWPNSHPRLRSWYRRADRLAPRRAATQINLV